MRYDTKIKFIRLVPGDYDETTGNYAEDTEESEERHASVMDTRTEFLKLIYGDIRQGSLTIQLQRHYTKPFDYIRINDNRYCVNFSRKLRHKHIFVVSEVQ